MDFVVKINIFLSSLSLPPSLPPSLSLSLSLPLSLSHPYPSFSGSVVFDNKYHLHPAFPPAPVTRENTPPPLTQTCYESGTWTSLLQQPLCTHGRKNYFQLLRLSSSMPSKDLLTRYIKFAIVHTIFGHMFFLREYIQITTKNMYFTAKGKIPLCAVIGFTRR